MLTMMRYARFLVLLLLVSPAFAAENIKSAVSAAAAEDSHVFCDGTGTSPVHKAPCFIRSVYVTTGATAGYLMTFNAASKPADGAVTTGGTGASSRVECVVAPANQTVSLDFGETSEQYPTGLTAVFSSTGCFTLTASATAFFKGRVN